MLTELFSRFSNIYSCSAISNISASASVLSMNSTLYMLVHKPINYCQISNLKDYIFFCYRKNCIIFRVIRKILTMHHIQYLSVSLMTLRPERQNLYHFHAYLKNSYKIILISWWGVKLCLFGLAIIIKAFLLAHCILFKFWIIRVLVELTFDYCRNLLHTKKLDAH